MNRSVRPVGLFEFDQASNTTVVHGIFQSALDDEEIDQLYDEGPVSSTFTADGFEDYTDHAKRYLEFGRLPYQFCDAVRTFRSSNQAFEMLENFVANCSESLKKCRGKREQFAWLESEYNIWRLILALYTDRLNNYGDCENADPNNEMDIMKNFFQREQGVRECQVVLSWLEDCAETSRMLGHEPTLPHFLDKGQAWENTLVQLQVKSVAYKSTRPLITSLDPDAPQRTKQYLHDLDAEDESRLLEQMFTEIRCGKLDAAMDLCKLSGHKWRAAVLQGWMLFNDPNYKREEGTLPAYGNPNRDIWKLCAWRMSAKTTGSAVWRAAVAAFCGNLNALLPMCKKWDDLLWAHLKVMIDVKVEQAIRSISAKKYADLPEQYWEYAYDLGDVFEELAGYGDNGVRLEAAKPHRVMQQLLISNRTEDLLVQMGEWCCGQNANAHLVRLCAHIVLFLKRVEYRENFNGDKYDNVLRAYVKILMKLDDPELLAYYTSTLGIEDQILHYAEYLREMEDGHRREAAFEAAEKCGLPIEAIAQTVVRMVRESDADVSKNEAAQAGVTMDDRKKISALDWLFYQEGQRVPALWETNALMRLFLMRGNVEAASLAFEKIPEDSIEVILSNLGIQEEGDIPVKVAAAIREYLCHKAYLMAEASYKDWRRVFQNDKPKAPVKLDENAELVDKIEHDQLQLVYNKKMKKWKLDVTRQAEIAKVHLYNVLTFPEGGWLVENRYFDEEHRLDQLNCLRKIHIPKVVLLLHNLLHEMEFYEDCMKLADVIVAEDRKIYKVYSPRDLAEVLKKFADTSVCFLNKHLDAWGHPVSS